MLEKLNALGFLVKVVIALVLAAAIGGGVWYGVVSPMEDQNKASEASLKSKQDENDKLRAFENRLPELERQIAQLKSQMELQKRIVPDDKDTDKFIVMLQEQASNAGINLRKLEAKGPSNKDFYTEVPFAMEADGPYYGMTTFFDKLAVQERIVNVENLTLKTTAKGGFKYPLNPGDSVAATFTAKTFYSREAPSAPAPAAAPAKK